jgi:hypothetical protein
MHARVNVLYDAYTRKTDGLLHINAYYFFNVLVPNADCKITETGPTVFNRFLYQFTTRK